MAIHPDYIKAVKDMNIGGIRLGSNTNFTFSMEMARDSVKKLKNATQLPVFVAADNGTVDDGVGLFGLGTYSGFLGNAGETTKECVQKRAYLNAFLNSADDVNVALGPAVDPSNRDKKMPTYWGFLSTARPEKVAELAGPLIEDFNHFGLATVLKHFPYTPVYMDPHQQNANIPDSREKVEEDIRAFKLLANGNGAPDFVMTTHLYNTNIDNTVATLSPKWIDILKKDVGYKGIIVTDGLHMMGAFKGADRQQFLSYWKGSEAGKISDDGIVAALSILAGHDMIFIDDDLKETQKVFKELHSIACQDDATGKALRKRVFESYDKIVTYKKKNEAKLNFQSDAPISLAREAVVLYSDLGSNKNNSCSDDNRFNVLKIKIESTVFKSGSSSINRRVQSL